MPVLLAPGVPDGAALRGGPSTAAEPASEVHDSPCQACEEAGAQTVPGGHASPWGRFQHFLRAVCAWRKQAAIPAVS